MLIIAIPKSASTSLLDTLGKLHGVPSEQMFFREKPIPSDLRILYRYHSDIREIDAEQAKLFSGRDRFFKQHIPPTINNLQLLRGAKKVILLRKPEEIVGAYYRAYRRGLEMRSKEISDTHTLSEWMQIAEENGLLEDLRWFYKTWLDESQKHTEVNLVIKYDDLLRDPKKTMNMVEEFFDFPVSEEVVLSKKRYSRRPSHKAFLHFLAKKLYPVIDSHPRLYRSLRFLRFLNKLIVRP